MKRYLGLFVCALALSAPAFAVEHIVTRSVKNVGKDTYKVTKVPVEAAGKATGSVVKVIF